jgi:Icc-related predicted phosphoesterase
MYRPELPAGDILVICGDILNKGTRTELIDMNQWLLRVSKNFQSTLFVAGNHDVALSKSANVCFLTGAILLNDKLIEIDGVKFYGHPWVPYISDRWAFQNVHPIQAKERASLIPDGVDVLLTHGPPYLILDQSNTPWGGLSRPFGCEVLRSEVLERIRPRVHCFGHIHSAHGTWTQDGIVFYNVCLVDEEYKHVYEPTVFDLSAIAQ